MWPLPCYISAWVNNRPKALFPRAVLDWSQPIPPEQHAKPSAELLQESAEVRRALKKGQTLLDFYKVKFRQYLSQQGANPSLPATGTT